MMLIEKQDSWDMYPDLCRICLSCGEPSQDCSIDVCPFESESIIGDLI